MMSFVQKVAPISLMMLALPWTLPSFAAPRAAQTHSSSGLRPSRHLGDVTLSVLQGVQLTGSVAEKKAARSLRNAIRAVVASNLRSCFAPASSVERIEILIEVTLDGDTALLRGGRRTPVRDAGIPQDLGVCLRKKLARLEKHISADQTLLPRLRSPFIEIIALTPPLPCPYDG